MPSQLLERISVRWLPEPAYEDTKTIALYVGDYFIDLRVQISDGAIQWSRAGKYRVLTEKPLTCEWTHIIDSLGLTEPDVATFTKLPNGHDLETGTYKNPNKGGTLSQYEEVWSNVTGSPRRPGEIAWILQSTDGLTFLGLLGRLYLGIKLGSDGGFDARKEERADDAAKEWKVIFASTGAEQISSATSVSSWTQEQVQQSEVGSEVELAGTRYVIRALDKPV